MSTLVFDLSRTLVKSPNFTTSICCCSSDVGYIGAFRLLPGRKFRPLTNCVRRWKRTDFEDDKEDEKLELGW